MRTVYNWFTGYHLEDGNESPGLTRRMVDIYLLSLVRKGVARISRKHGGWIDRNNIGGIDFKPDTLRSLERVDLPRPLEDWRIFFAYIEVMLSRREGSLGPVPEGSLGPAFDRGKADESLQSLWRDDWLRAEDIDRVDSDLKSFLRELGKESSFTELLVYWLDFAAEPRPETYDDQEVYDSVRRAVLKATGVSSAEDLTPEHLATFKTNFSGLTELRTSFGKTSAVLLRAAKLASAPVPDSRDFKEIKKVQKAVHSELESAHELILNPDRVNTRLLPRLQNLESVYVPAYLDQLIELDVSQRELEEATATAKAGKELEALRDFEADVAEAQECLDKFRQEFERLPQKLRRFPENRDAAETEVKQEGMVKGMDRSQLSLERITMARAERQAATESVRGSANRALVQFASFLKSPGIATALSKAGNVTSALRIISEVKSADDLAESLASMDSRERQTLAKELKAALGKKLQKTVRLSEFCPDTNTIFEKVELDAAATEFRRFLESKWEEGHYLKLET